MIKNNNKHMFCDYMIRLLYDCMLVVLFFILSLNDFLPAKKAQSPNDKNILVESGLSSMKESVEFFVKSPAKTLESLRLKHK